MAIMDYKQWFAAWKRRDPKARPDDPAVWARYANYKSTQERAAAPAAAAPAAAPSPPPQFILDPTWKKPTDDARQARINSLRGQRDAVQGIYNSRRLTASDALKAQMERSGLWHNATRNETTDANGNITYSFSSAPEGTAYRDAYRTASNQASQRGFGSSSDRWDDYLGRRTSLNKTQADAKEQYQNLQDSLADGQRTDWNALDGQLSAAQIEYGDWQSQQTAPTIENPAYTAFVNAQTAAPPSDAPGPSAARAFGQQVFAAGARPGDKHMAKYGSRVDPKQFSNQRGTWTMTRAGDGRWVLRWGLQ